MLIYLAREVQIGLLLTKKVTVATKYSDFSDVFSKKLAAELSERSDINKHSINL